LCKVIGKEIPHIAGLLKHQDVGIVKTGADALSKLSEQGQMHEIHGNMLLINIFS
jgi:hypothetical protein